MTSHTRRLYALAVSLVVFFLAWAAVAARPWASASNDPRVDALRVRADRLRREARLVDRIVAARWAVYRRELHARQTAAASVSPAVRVVTLPPLTITRTS